MAEEVRELSNEEIEDIAGGTIRVPFIRDSLTKLVKEAIAAGKPIDSVLARCGSDRQRNFVRDEWARLGAPSQ